MPRGEMLRRSNAKELAGQEPMPISRTTVHRKADSPSLVDRAIFTPEPSDLHFHRTIIRPAAVGVLRPWPEKAVDQLAAIGALTNARAMTIDDVKSTFTGAKRELVARHLETLALMGEVVVDAEGRYGVSRKAA